MNQPIIYALIFSSIFVSNVTQAEKLDFSGDATLVSDYIFRGASLSDGGPAAQLGLNATNDKGWSYRLFLSSYDVNGDTDARSEFSLNYRGKFDKYFDVLFGFKHYGYESEDRESQEWHFGLSAFNVSAIYHRDEELDTEYFDYGYVWQLDEQLSFEVHYGITRALYLTDSRDDYSVTANYLYSDRLSVFASVGGQNESATSPAQSDDYALIGVTFRM